MAFESSPSYLFDPEAAKRIAANIPDVKLIFILRDPVERAISHYFHVKRKGNEPLDMLPAFEAESSRIDPPAKSENYKDPDFWFYSYKARGQYLEQLQRYLNIFPRENVLILNSEEFFNDKEKALDEICDFLDVKRSFDSSESTRRNKGENRVAIPTEVRDYRSNHFKPYNEALFDFLGRRYDW